MVAPLKDRGVFLADVEIQVAPDDSIQVSAAQVFAALGKVVDRSALEDLRAVAEPGIFVPLERISQAGFPLAFNPRSLELNVVVPAASRGRQSIGLADLDRAVFGDFASPEPVSAYLNLRSAVDYVHRGSVNNRFSDTIVLMDGAIRLGGVVLENEATWSSGDRGFSRDGTRLVWDDAARLSRWTLGDLRQETRGFQGAQDMAGLSVVRSYAILDPQRNVTPRGGRTFTLEREGTVDAYVNGRNVRTIRLQPGTYDVSDFPFVQGSNDIELVIVDDTGRREVISFSIFLDRTQLAAGLSEFGFYGGVRSNRLSDEIDYSDEFVASGFYRRGLSDALTVGANFQWAEEAHVVGAEVVWGGSWGTFGADAAYSHIDVAGGGWALNASYERLVQQEGGGYSFVASIEARSRDFGSTGFFAPDNPYSFNAAVAVNKSFGDSSFAGLQLRYAKGRDATEDESSIRATYGRRLSDRINMIADVEWADGGFAEGTSFRLALVRRFGASGSIRADYESRSERTRLGYQTSGGRGVGAWSATANLDVDSDVVGFNGSASYAANRADLGLAHSTAFSQTADEISDQRTSLRLATGIAFAGGKVAIGRPITDGFVIAAPYAGARDMIVEVEPSPEGYYARSGALGPALYGQVTAYSPRSIVYDAPNAPPGFDIGQGAVRVLPPYRAGYVVTVGSEYGVTAIGNLFNREGEPVALLSGYAIEQGGEGRRVQVFTNRQGRFGASGLKAGRWRIEMHGEAMLVYDLIIPESPDGVARIGDLRPVNQE